MEHFLINSSVCLFVLWLAYKLLLENTSWHSFKRWFLIGSMIVSLCIPFIVVDTILIPIEETSFAGYDIIVEEAIIEETTIEINWWYVTLTVYSIGFVVMLWRYAKNLNSFRIQQEDEISSYKTYQLILRNKITIPHSFLKRIFVSKKDYRTDKIPEVVLEHEKVHLDQKHSIDILFIEALIVLLWFNPLLYIIRYSMKLNHEFLADQSVLNQGITTTEYQQLLLDHATTSYQQAMANTFTFPIIKKRFNIMKTHTSNTSLVLRSLALIPILALLIISCGKEETEFIEIEETIIVEDDTNQKLIIVDPNDPKGNITIKGEPHTYKIKGDQISIYNEAGELQDFESQGYQVRQAEVIEIIEILESVTQKDIDEYNFQAKKHQEYIEKNGRVVVFKEDTKRMQLIFNSMTEEQRAQNEPWPYLYWDNDLTPGDIPPPPPPAAPTKSPGFIKVDGKIYRYTLKENDYNFYDRDGAVIDVYGKTVEYVKQEDLPPPPPAVLQIITSNDVEKYNSWAKQINDTNNEAKKTGSNEYAIVKAKDVTIFKSIYYNMTKAQKSNAQPWPKLPPPPPPADPLDYFKDKGDKMNYYIDDVKVNASKAKAFIEKNGKKGVQVGPVNGVYSLKMYSKYHRMGYKKMSTKNDTTTWIKDFSQSFDVASKSEESKKRTIIKNGNWKDVQKFLKKGKDAKKTYIDQNPDNIYGPTRLDRDLKC